MTKTRKRRLVKPGVWPFEIQRLIADIRSCADRADLMKITLPNGAEPGGIMSGIADDIEAQMNKESK